MRGTAGRCACLQRAGTGNEKGYSLVELLAVTAVLALVLAAVFMFYENVLRSFARDTSQTEVQQNARVALDFVTGDLHLASQLVSREVYTVIDYRLPGENFQYTIRRRPEDNTLLRERRQVWQDGTLGLVDNTVMLASHITGFRVIPTGSVFTWNVELVAAVGGRQFTLDSTVSPRNLR
jgi:prepilin-type N-terminal cleavage/methylation domain-containing protein